MNKNLTFFLCFLFTIILINACSDKYSVELTTNQKWIRDTQNPVFQDVYPDGNYESASDAHVFYDEGGNLRMIYSGDTNGSSSIKLAKGNSLTQWAFDKSILFKPNSSNLDIQKETAFYRKAKNGRHQIYYIGYPDENTYQAQIFLADSEELDGPYIQIDDPVVPRGDLAGKSVYCITSPSIMEHDGKLYIAFLGWNDSPQNVSEVWVIGAISLDDGYTWSNFQIVETPIGMEGQVTQKGDGSFVAVRTGEYNGDEAIFYAKSNHPFGPWITSETPILTKNGSDLEKDEIIAPQITFNRLTGEEYLFYTGAEYQKGWWMMLAKKE